MSSTGIDATTGKPLAGWDHVLQSVRRIYSTRVGERVMRRQFGGGVSSLIGRRLTPRALALYRLLTVLALERWEPRVQIRSIAFSGTVDEIRDGRPTMTAAVDYLPHGHLGDRTVADQRTIELE